MGIRLLFEIETKITLLIRHSLEFLDYDNKIFNFGFYFQYIIGNRPIYGIFYPGRFNTQLQFSLPLNDECENSYERLPKLLWEDQSENSESL